MLWSLPFSTGEYQFGGHAYLPAVLYLLGIIPENWRLRRFLAGGAIVGAVYGWSVNLGEVFPFDLIVPLVWFVLVQRPVNGRRLFAALAFAIAVTSIRGPDIVALWLNAIGSHRQSFDRVEAGLGDLAIHYLLVPWRLQWIAVIIFIVMLVRRVPLPTVALRCLLAAAVLVGTALAGYAGKLILPDQLKFLSSFQWHRFSHAVAFLMLFATMLWFVRYPDPRDSPKPSFLQKPALIGVAVLLVFTSTIFGKAERAMEWLAHGSARANFEHTELVALAEQGLTGAYRVESSLWAEPSYAHALGLENANRLFERLPPALQRPLAAGYQADRRRSRPRGHMAVDAHVG